MGRAVLQLLAAGAAPSLQLTAAVDCANHPDLGKDTGLLSGAAESGIRLSSDLAAGAAQADVAIDFSFHTAVPETAAILQQHHVAWMTGITGLTPEEKAAIQTAAAHIPVILAANMSLGVNLLYALVEQAARALKGAGYDCEISERHHRRKQDSPSGTALFLGEAAAAGFGWNLDAVKTSGRDGLVGERPVEEIGFHAIRGGDIVGDHTVLFAADGEMIELSHRATTRATFAYGALRAAGWLAGKHAGMYRMSDVLGLTEHE